MKKLVALLLCLITLSVLCSCGSNEPSGNVTKNDADVRYSEGYYADMYQKITRVDLLAQQCFDYTVRVSQVPNYYPINNNTGSLFKGYNEVQPILAEKTSTDYFNYLSDKAYTYTFLNEEQCAAVYDEFCSQLNRAGLTELADFTVADENGQPTELFFQNSDKTQPGDILILDSAVGSRTITVGFLPAYDGLALPSQSDLIVDNQEIASVPALSYVLIIVGSVLGGLALVLVLVILIRVCIKKKQK